MVKFPANYIGFLECNHLEVAPSNFYCSVRSPLRSRNSISTPCCQLACAFLTTLLTRQRYVFCIQKPLDFHMTSWQRRDISDFFTNRNTKKPPSPKQPAMELGELTQFFFPKCHIPFQFPLHFMSILISFF